MKKLGRGFFLALGIGLMALTAFGISEAPAATTALDTDWCCQNTGCPGGPDNCITINPPGGGSVTCYKNGFTAC